MDTGRVYRNSAVLAVILFFATLCLSVLGFRSPSVTMAQSCEGAQDCSFPCTVNADDWKQDGTDGIWAIIEAKPKLDTGSAIVDARWRIAGMTMITVPMQIVVTWEEDGGASTVQASIDIDSDGTCSTGGLGNPDWIRCHSPDNIATQALCDNYSGTWQSILGTCSGTCLCVERYLLGVDMRRWVEDDSTYYCWKSMEIIPQNPIGYGLIGVANCASSSPLSYQNYGSTTWTCGSEERVSGTQSVLYAPIDYIYEP